jgi:hypothetical protein
LAVEPLAIVGHTGCCRLAALAPNIGIMVKPSFCPSLIRRLKPASPPIRAGAT